VKLETGGVFADRYEILARLGEGGMGVVYRAMDRELGDEVALKLLTPGIATPDSIERFRREVRLARRVTHPNVARVFDLGLWGDKYFLTMELVRGRSFDDVLDERGTLPPAEILTLARTLCEALVAAHAAGVIHRDLKPANVLVSDDGRVVITDFGIARAVGASDDKLKTQGPIGTPLYMAPEQISGAPVDARTDLFALGIMLYEMATGEIPHARDTAIATAVARLECAPLDHSSLAAVAAPLRELITRTVVRDPAGRAGSAQELLGLLDGALSATAAQELAATMVASAALATSAPRTGEQILAVLPFRMHGPPELAYLGDAIADELADTLTSIKGLRTVGTASTRGPEVTGNPRALGSLFGVTAAVEGTVQVVGPRVRISVRLIDVSSGEQRWADRYEGTLEDVLDLQDRIARRVAEVLRVRVTAAGHPGSASAEVVELYLRGKRKTRMLETTGPDGALALLSRALELAPNFKPAIAHHAIASVREWFVPDKDRDGDPRQAAIASVGRAEALAGELPETQLAVGWLALQEGDTGRAVRAFGAVLEAIPTYTEAQEILGSLEAEVGLTDRALVRLRHAADFDTDSVVPLTDLARLSLLTGDAEGYAALQQEIDRRGHDHAVSVMSIRCRAALWAGDRATVERLTHGLLELPIMRGSVVEPACTYTLGEIGAATAFARIEARTDVTPRMRSLAWQLMTELLAVAGDREMALSALERAAAGALTDIVWMDRCPVLDTLRDEPRFARAREVVEARAEVVRRAASQVPM